VPGGQLRDDLVDELVGAQCDVDGDARLVVVMGVAASPAVSSLRGRF